MMTKPVDVAYSFRLPSSSTSQLFVLLACSSLSTPLLSPLFLLRLRSGCHHGYVDVPLGPFAWMSCVVRGLGRAVT